jgi:hypothetical protein
MKVQIMMSVSGLMEVDVPDDKKEALEVMLEEANGRSIGVEEFEEVTGLVWDWDNMLNSLDFEIDDVEIPGVLAVGDNSGSEDDKD